MLIHPGFNPVAISFGSFNVRWYGIMYLLGFISGWVLGRYRAKESNSGWIVEQVDDLVFHVALGVNVCILFGYLGY